MKRVLKWRVPVDDASHEIGGGRVVHVDIQDGYIETVYVWTEEDDKHPFPAKFARVFGTGQDLGRAHRHLGSVSAGPFVWHVYEVGEKK